ncbi:glycosyltransferase family 20-domain-containing protein [Globomyces pollinis-pini]|nr:glycosyltransferase family 20-domain-containing protein [Globomyces pollinis-pini]
MSDANLQPKIGKINPNQRTLIAAMFLPISATKDTAKITAFPTPTKRNSFISTLATLSELKYARKSLKSFNSDLLTAEFSPSNTGNPGLYNAVKSMENRMAEPFWIGTLGSNTDELDDIQKRQLENKLTFNHNCYPVYVTQDEVEGHYNQFCKQVLWKPFHYQLSDYSKSTGKEEDAWKYYIQVNQLFANSIVKNYQTGDIIWVNDYHLMLVPEMVRKLIPKATIGFFLHIPFPSSEIFRCLSVRKQLLNGLLAADLVGFQIHAFMRHFLMTCSRLLSLDSTPKAILMDNSTVAVGSYPIGIDLETLNRKRKHPEVKNLVELLKEKYAGKFVVIGRDKNDYVKGVSPKLLAFERFLEDHPEMHGKVVLIQVSLSTAEANELETKVSGIVGRINSKFGTIEYVPIVYLHQDISFNHYLALLTMADACLITSLRDGMNLTSHEYVVCQDEKHSPLIISEFAGTYSSFGAALRVNPWDTTEVANAIHEALTMSSEDKEYRWKMLYSYVSENTAQKFVETYLEDLRNRHEENTRALATSIPFLSFEYVRYEYSKSQKRLLLLDDDGTLLTGECKEEYIPSQVTRMTKLLETLCSDPKNMVYLMSSRPRAELKHLSIPNLGICAESGCFIRFPDRNSWESMVSSGSDLSWRGKVREVFEYYTDRTPGSFIEEKEIGIAWHYSSADMKYGDWQAAECQNHINNTLQNFPIHILQRKRCIEVYLRNVSKATGIRRILQHHQAKYYKAAIHSADSELPHTPTLTERASFVSERNSVVAEQRSSIISDRTSVIGERHSISDFKNRDPGEVKIRTDLTELKIKNEICDLILCIGNDRADEYMFEYLRKLLKKQRNMNGGGDVSLILGDDNQSLETNSVSSYQESAPTEVTTTSLPRNPELKVITCTVGCKSSAARWHVSNVEEVVEGLSNLFISS